MFQTVMIIDCRNGCHPLLLPVSPPWDEVCASQSDLATPLFKMWSLVHQSLTLAGAMTCIVQLKWQKHVVPLSNLDLRNLFASAHSLGPLPLPFEQTSG